MNNYIYRYLGEEGEERVILVIYQIFISEDVGIHQELDGEVKCRPVGSEPRHRTNAVKINLFTLLIYTNLLICM